MQHSEAENVVFVLEASSNPPFLDPLVQKIREKGQWPFTIVPFNKDRCQTDECYLAMHTIVNYYIHDKVKNETMAN